MVPKKQIKGKRSRFVQGGIIISVATQRIDLKVTANIQCIKESSLRKTRYPAHLNFFTFRLVPPNHFFPLHPSRNPGNLLHPPHHTVLPQSPR